MVTVMGVPNAGITLGANTERTTKLPSTLTTATTVIRNGRTQKRMDPKTATTIAAKGGREVAVEAEETIAVLADLRQKKDRKIKNRNQVLLFNEKSGT